MAVAAEPEDQRPPSLLVAGLAIVVVLGAFDLPVLGAVAGVGVALVALVALGPLLAGADVSGATAF